MSWEEDRGFVRAVSFTVSPRVEGTYSVDPEDKGNWTGGSVGVGELQGTKFGISAAAYPQLDIKSLSWNQAAAIYYRDYWLRAGCDKLPPRVGMALFDAVVNHGPSTGVRLLQESIESEGHGTLSADDIAKIWRGEQEEVIIDFLEHRLAFYRALKMFSKYGRGWTRRVVRLAMEVARA